jgi:hydrogenase/urease accessory protein HupE
MSPAALYRAGARVLAVVAALVALPLHAHLMPAGQGTVRLVGDSAYVVVAVPASLLRIADDNQDGLIAVAEIDRHRAALDALVSQRLQLQAGGEPGRLVFSDLLISHAEDLAGRGADAIAVARRYQWAHAVETFSIQASIFEPGKPQAQFLVRASFGELHESAVLTPDRADAAFFTGPLQVFTRALRLGAEHILIGADHLLFLLTVLVAGAGWRYWVAVVTTFTVAHSITLGGAVLGVVSAPPALVEPLIAASIVLLALDNIVRGQAKLGHRLFLIFGCGLLHGLGIASVLTESAVSSHNLVATLVGFNLGIELGQLVFVAGALAVLGLFKRAAPGWQHRLVTSSSVVAAVVGSLWLLERVWG